MKTNETSTKQDLSQRDLFSTQKALAWWNNKPNYSHQSKNSKESMYNKYFVKGNLFTTARFYNELTYREIKEIWRKETSHIDPSDIEAAYRMQVEANQKQSEIPHDWKRAKYLADKTNQKQYSQEEVNRLLDHQAAKTTAQVLKSNQKQFKEFDETLFKSYITKFSDEGRVKAHQILWKSLNRKIQNQIIEAICNPDDFE